MRPIKSSAIRITVLMPLSCRCYYTNYTTTASTCDDFFADANAITLYKDWVKTIATRNNSITGVTYGNDPTIFAWDLMNEPRCESGSPSSCSAAAIQVLLKKLILKLLVRLYIWLQSANMGKDEYLSAASLSSLFCMCFMACVKAVIWCSAAVLDHQCLCLCQEPSKAAGHSWRGRLHAGIELFGRQVSTCRG